jgi:Tol biopolymer transport system component
VETVAATHGRGRRRAAIAASCLALLAAMPATAAAAPYARAPWKTSTHPHAFGQAPELSPSGKSVVAGEDHGQGMQLYRSRLDGSRQRCLTCTMSPPNMVPVWRPQGDRILFHAWRTNRITIGAPGFGGLGSNLSVMRPDGSDVVELTTDPEGEDNFHAYWSPDGRQVVWTHINCNFVEDEGRCRWDIRLARYRQGGDRGPRLADIRVVRPGNGHFYETQWWAPDGSGFLFTESVDTAVNLELFFYRLKGAKVTRLTDNLAWDEQAIFTPDMKSVIFMSSRDHPGFYNTYSTLADAISVRASYDHVLSLPIFEVGFLQPVFPEATDLYQLDLRTQSVRRLTDDGDDGWIIPEFVWDHRRDRLFWTESKFVDGVRVDLPPDVGGDVGELSALITDPGRVDTTRCVTERNLTCLLDRRTRVLKFDRRR